LIEGKQHCRWFAGLESVFEWLKSELHNPTTGMIEIWHENAVLPNDDHAAKVEQQSKIPFAVEP
jgi:hypothetical protein